MSQGERLEAFFSAGIVLGFPRTGKARRVASSGLQSDNALRLMSRKTQIVNTESASQFSRVATIYDDLMRGISYGMWVQYVRQLWGSRGCRPRSVLDVACGTGNMSFRLAEGGIRVVGVDYAEAMIRAAKEKQASSPGFEKNPVFICQNACDMHLGETFDAAISLFDSLNYILDYADLKKAFSGVFQHLCPGGVFVFDMNTVFALRHHFFDQDNLSVGSYPRYMWRSTWDESTHLCTVEMDFEFMEHGVVEQFHETHRQRGYTLEEVSSALEDTGFVDTQFYNAYSFRPLRARSDRLYCVCSRPSI